MLLFFKVLNIKLNDYFVGFSSHLYDIKSRCTNIDNIIGSGVHPLSIHSVDIYDLIIFRSGNYDFPILGYYFHMVIIYGFDSAWVKLFNVKEIRPNGVFQIGIL